MAGQKKSETRIEKICVTELTESVSLYKAMKKRNLKNSDLDAIGAKLLRVSMTGDEAIEQIVANPRLFEAVNLRIADESGRHVTDRVKARKFSLLTFDSKALAGGFAVLVVMVSVYAYLTSGGDDSKLDVAVEQAVPETKTIADYLPEPAPVKVVNIAKRPPVRKRPVERRRTPKIVKTEQIPANNIEEFYALTAAGNLDDHVRDGKIIRVDMSPSSLYSLGVNLPLENEANSIRTEILVGTDGVAHAIRRVD